MVYSARYYAYSRRRICYLSVFSEFYCIANLLSPSTLIVSFLSRLSFSRWRRRRTSRGRMSKLCTNHNPAQQSSDQRCHQSAGRMAQLATRNKRFIAKLRSLSCRFLRVQSSRRIDRQNRKQWSCLPLPLPLCGIQCSRQQTSGSWVHPLWIGVAVEKLCTCKMWA